MYPIFQSQSIDFKNAFVHAYIPIGDPTCVEIPRYLKIDEGQNDVVLRLNKYYIFNAKPHASGMKNGEIIC